ncbi:acid protease [Sarocladium strictum]
MRSTQLLAHLALWTTTAHAFYPYTPSWMEEEQEARSLQHKERLGSRDGRGVRMELVQRGGKIRGTPSERAAREAARLSGKYVTESATNALLKRNNNYEVMEAVDSGKSMTAGISQDGTDYSYFIKVQLGSKGKEVYMLVDSASGTSWVMGPDCKSMACGLHDSFGPDDSDTFESSTEDFSISYGTGKVQGKLAKDTISVAGVSFKFQLGIADEASDDFQHYAFDGILGLSLGKGKTQNFLDVMSDDGDLKDNIFSVALSRASDGVNNGEILFGAIDPERYSGKITYSNIVSGSTVWAIELDEMAYDGKKAGVGGTKTYIDTGSTFIYGPQDLAKKIHSVIPEATSSDGGLSYKVPCDSEKDLTFTFSGASYKLSPKDWISPPNSAGECTSNIYGHDVAAGALLLGATFVKNVYVVFDKDKERIGFAPLVEVTEEVEESTTTSAASSTKNTESKGQPTATPTESSASSEETSETTEEATSKITALPDTEAKTEKPSLGLTGPERPSATTTEEEAEPQETDNAATSQLVNGKMCLGALLATLLALMA